MQSLRAVLADDDEAGRQVYRQLLTPDVEVMAMVGDGEAAIKAVEVHRPDIVLLDVSMPILDGFSVARRLKQRMPQLKVVFLTLHDEPEYLREAADIGAEGYVIKRNASSELLAAVRNAMCGMRHYPQPALLSR